MAGAVLVMAKAPRAGEVKTRLEPLLGPSGCAELARELLAVALAWARGVAGEAVWVAYAPSDAHSEMAALAGDARLIPQRGGDLGARLTAACEEVFAVHAGPLLVVGTDLPTLRPVHAENALDDLAHGVEVSIGRSGDGGYYLIALDAHHPEVFALPPEAWGGPQVFELTLAAAHAAGLSLGMLRLENDLDTPADARLLLLDPHLPESIAALLRPALERRPQ